MCGRFSDSSNKITKIPRKLDMSDVTAAVFTQLVDVVTSFDSGNQPQERDNYSNDSASVFHRYPGIQLYRRFIPDVIDLSKALLVVWLTVGFVGNALSAKIWAERRMRQRNSSAVYVAALPINSLAFLLFYLIDRLMFHWDINLYAFPIVCETVSVLYFIPQYMSQLLVLGFTVDRYIVVCHPLRRKALCRSSRAFKVDEQAIFICCFDVRIVCA